MISSSLINLYPIISDDKNSFEDVSKSFRDTYKGPSKFKTEVTLCLLLQDKLLNLSQRLAAFYILYDMHSQDKGISPYLPLVLETLSSSSNSTEKRFLLSFIQKSFHDAKTVIKDYIVQSDKEGSIEVPDLSSYWEEYNNSKGKSKSPINHWVRPVVYDRKESDSNKIENQPPFDLSQLTSEEASFNYFEPNYMTFYPNTNYSFIEDEPMWIMPTLNYDFVWDFTMTPEQDNVASIINKPLNDKPVLEEQMTYALEIIERNPNVLKEINFTPESLMKLVDKDVNFAEKILLKISKAIIFQDYLTPFVSNDFNSNALKVLNILIQHVELPKEFLSSYIKKVIGNLKKEANKDTKTIMARLLAFFTTNLLTHRHLNVDDIPKEIEELFSIAIEEVETLKRKLIELKNPEQIQNEQA